MSPEATPRGRLDPTFDVDATPRVAGNNSLWPLMFGVLGALALGALVFLQLSSNQASLEKARIAEQQQAAATVAPAPAPTPYYPPPPEEMAPQPEPAPPTLVDVTPAAPPPPVTPGPTQAEMDRLRAPALVIDLGEYKAPAAGLTTGARPPGTPGAPGGALDAAAIAGTVTGAANAGAASTNPNERFAQRFGGVSGAPASAKHMGDLSTTIIEGSVIPAVLETALNSDAPGFVRGVVTRDVRGFDGSKVLVPRGSRLVGEYNSGTVLGQSRAFVIWTRLIRPDGATIDLASPAADGLGQGGIGGRVDTHFLQRFGGAILLSLLNIGASAVSDSADTTVVIAGARAGADAAGAALGGQGADIGPTITVLQGTPVRVFVSQDLSFAAVGPAPPSDASN